MLRRFNNLFINYQKSFACLMCTLRYVLEDLF